LTTAPARNDAAAAEAAEIANDRTRLDDRAGADPTTVDHAPGADDHVPHQFAGRVKGCGSPVITSLVTSKHSSGRVEHRAVTGKRRHENAPARSGTDESRAPYGLELANAVVSVREDIEAAVAPKSDEPSIVKKTRIQHLVGVTVPSVNLGPAVAPDEADIAILEEDEDSLIARCVAPPETGWSKDAPWTKAPSGNRAMAPWRRAPPTAVDEKCRRSHLGVASCGDHAAQGCLADAHGERRHCDAECQADPTAANVHP